MIAEKEETRKISISEFKARCTEEIRTVEETGEIIEITRHGKIVARLEPVTEDRPKTMAELMGSLRHTALFTDDELESFTEPTWKDEEWNALRDDVDFDGEPVRENAIAEQE